MYAVNRSNKIVIPDNLYIIGTMNTADRSIGHIDYAIKRRFAFVPILPSEEPIKSGNFKAPALKLFQEVAKLFKKEVDKKDVNSDYMSPDFDYKDVQLGHSYFLLKDGDENEQKAELEMRLEYEILPILNDYVNDGVLLETARKEIEALKI
jgi:5-methylcytosine-specific restriction endonuclease McrBC GTP-binding regulatory subunit McrB